MAPICRAMKREKEFQEEEILLWRMHFAELRAAGQFIDLNDAEASETWKQLEALDATPT